MLGLCGFCTLFLRVCKSAYKLQCQGERHCIVFTRLWSIFLTCPADTWKEATDINHYERWPHEGFYGFSGHQLARRLAKLDKWDRWDRAGTVPAHLRFCSACIWDALFLPENLGYKQLGSSPTYSQVSSALAEMSAPLMREEKELESEAGALNFSPDWHTY